MIAIPRKLARRAALKGLLGGTAVTVGVPFLDCFLDGKGEALAADGGPLPVRFGTWFWGLGHTPGRAIAGGAGTDWHFHQECAALEPYRQHCNFFSAYNLPLDGKPSTVHFTGYIGAKTGTVPSHAGHIPAATFDTLIADAIGGGTRFRSLELVSSGNPKDSYSFRGPGNQNVGDVSPARFYARVFGPEFHDPNAATFTPDPALMARASVLSAVKDEAATFMRTVGSADKARMDEYFTSIRQMEQRLALEMEKPPPLAACRRPAAPADGPVGVELETVQTNHKLFADILAMAVACNQTKVFNMVYAMAASEVRHRGAAFTHHILTHEEPPDPKLGYQVQAAALNERSMEAFALFIEAFARVKEGNGSLLDRVLIFGQTDTSLAKTHSVDGVPVITVGSAGGRVKTGLHLTGRGDPTTRIGLTMMQAMGVPIAEWGTGSLRTNKPLTEILT